jgi:thioredoxin 1
MIEITDRDFDKEVLECEIPVFACFTARWCRTCFPTCLVAAELTEEYNDRVKFVRVDIEESAETAERYHITAVPTILIFQDSQAAKRLLSFQDHSYLKSILDSLAAERDLSHE